MTDKRLLLSALLFLSACANNSAIEESRTATRLGDTERAFLLLDRARDELVAGGDTPTAEFEQAWGAARKAALLGRARLDIFEEREELALADLATLKELDPDYPGADELRHRALLKRAGRSTQEGDERLLRKDLHGAMRSYLAALSVVPDFEPALDGSDRVRESLKQLSDRAQAQFLEAVRKLPEFRYVEVRWHTDIAVTMDPGREDAESIGKKAQRELAMRALERGRECQSRDQFGAALLEFRTARKLDPSLPGADDLVATAEREVEASSLAERAQRAMRMGQFDVARHHLDKALALTTMAKTAITELIVQLRRMEGESRYQAARDLEVLGKKEEALAAFEELVKAWPEGLVDEKGRVAALRIDVESAAAEWEKAEAAEKADDPVSALMHYEAAMQFYPGWKDGPDRVKRLREKVVPKNGAERKAP